MFKDINEFWKEVVPIDGEYVPTGSYKIMEPGKGPEPEVEFFPTVELLDERIRFRLSPTDDWHFLHNMPVNFDRDALECRATEIRAHLAKVRRRVEDALRKSPSLAIRLARIIGLQWRV